MSDGTKEQERAAPTLRQQADAVKLAWVNKRGHAATLHDLVAKGRRPQSDLDQVLSQLPLLRAAAVTLNELALKEPSPATIVVDPDEL